MKKSIFILTGLTLMTLPGVSNAKASIQSNSVSCLKSDGPVPVAQNIFKNTDGSVTIINPGFKQKGDNETYYFEIKGDKETYLAGSAKAQATGVCRIFGYSSPVAMSADIDYARGYVTEVNENGTILNTKYSDASSLALPKAEHPFFRIGTMTCKAK